MDTITETPTARPIEKGTYIRAKDCGHPGKWLSDDAFNRGIVGRVIGFATSVNTNSVEDRETGEIKMLKSLSGSFEIIPVDVERSIKRSGKLQLPEHMIADIVAYLEKEDAKGKRVNAGEIAVIQMDIGLERAKNATGYSWFARMIAPVEAGDPLLALRSGVAPTATALAAPAGEPVAPAGEPDAPAARDAPETTAEAKATRAEPNHAKKSNLPSR